MFETIDTNTTLNTDRWAVSVPRAAYLLDVSEEFIRKQIRDKKLRATKAGSKVIIRTEWLEEFIAN